MEEETGTESEIENQEEEASYFFDSYAIIEILKENQNYLKFQDKPIIILLVNLAEIYWHCINDLKFITEADNVFSKFRKCVVDIDDETLKESIKFRKEHKKRDLSYIDCFGYIYAKRHGLKFLTGDKEFEHLPNVEFVK
jgi:PIN domain nuclease of toxin-antitoxin system